MAVKWLKFSIIVEPLVVTSGNLWQIVEVFGNLWHTPFCHYWQLLTIHSLPLPHEHLNHLHHPHFGNHDHNLASLYPLSWRTKSPTLDPPAHSPPAASSPSFQTYTLQFYLWNQNRLHSLAYIKTRLDQCLVNQIAFSNLNEHNPS